MFIICPKCSAKYKIPEGIQLESGQKLKCSACNFVFLKGEEAPLTLESPIIPTESFVTPASTSDAFSAPLHSISELQTSAEDSLPEAFKPLDTPPSKQKRGIGIVFIYLFFVIALCVLGWMFRDTLKPSLQTAFPSLTLEEAKPVTKVRQNSSSVSPQKVQPLDQPIVVVEELPKEEKKVDQPIEVPPKKNVIPPQPKQETVLPAITLPKPVPVTSPKTPEKKIESSVTSLPTATEIKEVIPSPKAIQPEVILPAPTSDLASDSIADLKPVMPEPTPMQEEEVVPLFEVMEPPLPAGGETELSISTISFRVEPTEEGVDQVLIEGQIQNNAPDQKSLPVLTVLAVDKDGQVLAQKKVHTATDILESGNQIPFYTSILPAPVGIDHIEVKF